MKLLMITRKVDKADTQAGFTYNWVKEIGQRVNQLKVICLEKGNLNDLPENVEVFSIGKERGKNRLREIINFQIGALKFIRQVDGVFCHQNPEYTILIAPYAKIFKKKIVTWYSHKSINWKVRLINILADKIVTPTKESCRLDSKNKIITGHGIDVNLFKPLDYGKESEKLTIISVGRISPIKNYETLIESVSILKGQGIDLKVEIIGLPGLISQINYFERLKQLVKERQVDDYIVFLGGLPQYDLVRLYQTADLSVNLCPTGSPDKAVLESMACALPVLAANETFRNDFGLYADQLIFKHGDSDDLAKKIISLGQNNQLEEIGRYLRERVVKYHNLDKLVLKIIECF